MGESPKVSGLSLDLPTSQESGLSLFPPEHTQKNGSGSIELSAILSSRLDAVTTLSLLSARNCSYQDLCRESLHVFRKALPSEAGSFFEFRHADQSLFVRSAYGQAAEKIESVTVPTGLGIVGHVAESRTPMTLSGDIAQSRVFLSKIADAVGFDAHSVLVVPVIIRGKIFGVVELLNRLGKDSFDKNDVETAEVIARVMASTFEVRLMLAYALGAQGQSVTKDSVSLAA